MSRDYPLAGASEFPNDNPRLHAGARWVCRATSGAPRAVLRYDAATAPAPLSGARRPTDEAQEGPSSAAPESGVVTRTATKTRRFPWATSARPALQVPTRGTEEYAAAVERALRFKGPMDLALDSIVIPHRVEDIPPPPAFIYEAVLAHAERELQRVTAARLAAEARARAAIVPARCHTVGAHRAAQRVERAWRVDIAPCLPVDGAPAQVEPAAEAPQPERRRRRGNPSELPMLKDLSRAIAELEAAFGERKRKRPELPFVERRRRRSEVPVERRATP